MPTKKIRFIGIGGISVRDQLRLEPELLKKKYRVNIKLPNGKVRYLFLDNPHTAELYVKLIGAKILKITKL